MLDDRHFETLIIGSSALLNGLPKILIAAVLRTRAPSETQGLLKALISTHSDEILGFSGLETQAGELTSIVQTTMIAKLPYASRWDALFTRPTRAEGLDPLFATVPVR